MKEVLSDGGFFRTSVLAVISLNLPPPLLFDVSQKLWH